MRVILDTNVIISGLALRPSRSGRLLEQWQKGRFYLLCCEEQIAEIRRVSRYSKLTSKLNPPRVGSMVNDIRASAKIISKLPQVDVSPDPFDNFLLAMAQAGSADYLVTGDKADLLSLASHGATRIVSVRQFADLLGL